MDPEPILYFYKKLIAAQQLKMNGAKKWGGVILFAHGTTASCGVCILIKPKFFCNLRKIVKDLNGRFIMCEMETEDNNVFTLCNIYAPNKDSPVFFDMIHQNIVDLDPNIIMGGDYNLVF